MNRRPARGQHWILLLLVVAWAYGCSRPVRVLTIPEGDPVAVASADAVRPGMTAAEVADLAGEPGVFGAGVSPTLDHPWGTDVYHVFWDIAMTHDRANGTWLYPIANQMSPPDPESKRYLFVEMRDGVVRKVYQGRIGSWSM